MSQVNSSNSVSLSELKSSHSELQGGVTAWQSPKQGFFSQIGRFFAHFKTIPAENYELTELKSQILAKSPKLYLLMHTKGDFLKPKQGYLFGSYAPKALSFHQVKNLVEKEGNQGFADIIVKQRKGISVQRGDVLTKEKVEEFINALAENINNYGKVSANIKSLKLNSYSLSKNVPQIEKILKNKTKEIENLKNNGLDKVKSYVQEVVVKAIEELDTAINAAIKEIKDHANEQNKGSEGYAPDSTSLGKSAMALIEQAKNKELDSKTPKETVFSVLERQVDNNMLGVHWDVIEPELRKIALEKPDIFSK